MKAKLMIIVIGILIISCNETQRNNQQIPLMATRIKIDELKSELKKLEIEQTEFDFIGITSNGTDCIYFTFENGQFNIEFEAINESQIPFIERLKEFANSNNLGTKITTYNNKAQYKSDKPAPVLRIEANTNIEKIAEIGQNIQHQIFINNKETIYEVVP